MLGMTDTREAERVWRDGFAPSLPAAGLRRLLGALTDDDPRLVQGATCTPPPLMAVQDWLVEAADIIAFCFWTAGCKTVGEVEEGFAHACYECDMAVGPSACGWVLNEWDDTPRHRARATFIPWVADALVARGAMSEDEAAFYRRIAENLDDQAPRLVLADWRAERAGV